MKLRIKKRLYVLVLSILFWGTLSYGEAGDCSKIKVAEKLLEYLNRQLPGAHFKTDLEKCSVQSVGKNRYRVIFKDSSFSTGFHWMLKGFGVFFPGRTDSFPEIDRCRIKETEIIYTPVENYISTRSMKGITFDFDYTKSGEKDTGSMGAVFKVKKIHIRLGKLYFEKQHADDRADPGKEGLQDLVRGNFFMILVPEPGTTIESIKAEISGSKKDKKEITYLLEVERISSTNNAPAPQVIDSSRNAKPSNFSKTSQKRLTLIDAKFHFEEIIISIKRDNNLWGSGSIDSFFYSVYIKPCKTGESFRNGFGIGIKNVQFSLPTNKKIELLSNIKDFQLLISLAPIPPNAVKSLEDFFRKAYKLKNRVDKENTRELFYYGMKAGLEVVSLKPTFKFVIAPLKHYFGEVEVKAEIRVNGPFIESDQKVSIRFFKIEEILNRLEESGMLPISTQQMIRGIAATYLKREENGDAEVTIESNHDQPGKIFINGFPMQISLWMSRSIIE